MTIGAIEVFLNEYAFSNSCPLPLPAMPNGLRVACVGSGPASLACADELAKLGFAVTVFESRPHAGGLLMNGIPAFKLEKSVVDRRVGFLKQRGVRFELGKTIGRDITLGQLRRDYDAIFLGIGCEQPKPLDIPGAELRGVHEAIPFLIQKNVAGPHDLEPIDCAGKRVAVLGGGDTAMDCLRTALRSGAKSAACIYRRDLENMPGSRKEYLNAVEEGAKFYFLTNPTKLEGDAQGAVAKVHCVRMELGAPDASGRRKPRPVPGSETALEAELILVAYGFDPVPFKPGSDFAAIKVNEWGGITVDENQMTSEAGIFSGGDSVRGAQLVVHAVRDGRKAAEGIVKWLAGKKPIKREPAPAALAQPG